MHTWNEISRRGFLLAAGASPLLRGQSLLRSTWSAKWIGVPKAPATEYGVYHFRRGFALETRPEKFVVHASGDNRYQLFVNGQRVAWGPARGDLFHWRYETVDITGFLRAGRNVIAAVVWNFGELAPEAQITLQTGFLLQGDTEKERVVDTGTAWKCARDESYSPAVTTSGDVRGYYVAGPGDRIRAEAHPWGWAGLEFDDAQWAAAVVIGPAAGREARDVHSRWMLVPRTIPMMEEKAERPMTARAGAGNRMERKGDGGGGREGDVAAGPDVPDDCVSGTDGIGRQGRGGAHAVRGGAVRPVAGEGQPQ